MEATIAVPATMNRARPFASVRILFLLECDAATTAGSSLLGHPKESTLTVGL
jgi:hypothetical protein